MIENDEELDLIYESRKNDKLIQSDNESLPTQMDTEFSRRMDSLKISILQNAQKNDKDFANAVNDNLKIAAVKYTEVEQGKADYQKQRVKYESELLDTYQQQNEFTQQSDKWDNRRKRRQYHYDGVKPIMMSVNIKEPMNLFFLYFLTAILVIPFLLGKFIKGTIGALIAGASNGDRPKAIKGFLWTIFGLFCVGIFAGLTYLFLEWRNII